MNLKTNILVAIGSATLTTLLIMALVLPLSTRAEINTATSSGVPTVFTYQGYLTDADDEPLNSTTNLRFRIYDQESEGILIWGPFNQTVNVQDGYFSVDLSPDVATFNDAERWLEISIQEGSSYTTIGHQQIGAVPYAMQAATLNLQNVLIVAKVGGNFNNIQAAIDSISDASTANAYLVWVAPGTYTETVILKPHVHLQGAGPGTIITSNNGNDTYPNASTLELSSNTSARDLSVENMGSSTYNVAVLAPAGSNPVSLANVGAEAKGAGDNNYGIHLTGTNTRVLLENVSALGEKATTVNCGLYNANGANATLRGGFYTGRGGSSHAYGILNTENGSKLDAESVTALAETNSYKNTAFWVASGGVASVRGGSFTARNGTHATGIGGTGTNTILEIVGTTSLVDNGDNIYSLSIGPDAKLTVNNGYFHAKNGTSYTIGINSQALGAVLAVQNATIEASSSNGNSYSIYHQDGTVNISHSRLVGGYIFALENAINCVAVSYDNNFYPTACPANP